MSPFSLNIFELKFLERKKNKKVGRPDPFTFLWIVLVVRFDVGHVVDLVIVVDVDIDVVDVFNHLILCLRNISLRKPIDGEILVKNHGANEKVLEEDTPPTLDADVSAVIADASTPPIVRAVVVLHPYHAFIAVVVEVEREKVAVYVRIPMPPVWSDNRCNRFSHRSCRSVPIIINVVEVVVDVVEVVEVVVDVVVEVVEVVVVDVVKVLKLSHV